ncbi:DNRLRE domain-containing protein [Streptomyces sp. NBC_00846]|uniref:LamG-like jellyroll fold domain-containing protein n=1 Tax=Streptomyces sp. NBC_00846 TaxID=2975849 RepID=UPI003866429B|nr:DNRLRE domain-containing protein [Streptomyces sp. NBC_00846]
MGRHELNNDVSNREQNTIVDRRCIQRRRRSRRPVLAVTLTALLATGMGFPALSGELSEAAAAPAEGRAAAGTEAAQQVAAETDSPVEVLSLRDERSTTVANPDGTFTTTTAVQPVRTSKDGRWVDIDTTLVRQADGSYAPKAAVSAMSFSGGGATTFATIEKDGRALSLDWPGKLPPPTVDGPTATYRDVLPGVDLKGTANAEGFSHLIVVKDAEAADNPELAELQLLVDTTAVELNKSDDGALTAIDAAGGIVFEAPAPLMWDSSQGTGTEERPESALSETAREDAAVTPPDGARVADVDVRLGPDTMTLTPDSSLLTGDDTVYPVYIDPVVKTASRTGWTMVSSYYSSAEFWKFGNHEGVGRCPADVSYQCASSNDKKRQFFAIPTASFEGKDIIKAEFAVTMVHTYSSSAKAVQLGRVNSTGASAISSSTNWGNQPSLKETITSKSPTNPAGSCTSTNQNVRFDVKGTVQKAADSGWDVTTFRLGADNEDDYAYWKRFCGNAHLEVTYNRPPLAPAMSDLGMAPGGSCQYGHADEHYVSEAPVLSAVIKDYDHNDTAGKSESLKARFHVFWTKGSAQVDHYATTGARTTTGTGQTGSASFKYQVGSDLSTDSDAGFTIPSNVTIGWEVQGSDGTAWGPWSSVGAATRCEFIYDASAPAAPVISSLQYPNDDAWHAGVGDYGSFTFDSPSTDVAHYQYRFKGSSAWSTVATATPGGPATVKFMPTSEGDWSVEAKAVDAAGNAQKTPMGYVFLVADGRAPVGGWTLGDIEGSGSAAGTGTSPSAAAGAGVSFGAKPGPLGAADTYAALDGTEKAYLDAGRHIVDTDTGFSVSAWVNLTEVPKQDQTVVSQDGTGLPGFELGYDADSRSWVFRAPFNDLESMGDWQVTGGKAVPGVWTHLIGSYDGVTGVMRLYVDGAAVTATTKRTAPWNAAGTLQIGRRLTLEGYTAHLRGGIADVTVYDRVVTGPESADLGGIVAQQLAYWDVDSAPDGLAPEAGGGTGLLLGGGASIYVPAPGCDPEADPECVETAPEEPMWGDGHLLLNGTDAYATRAAGLLSKQDSFALTARARLSSVSPTKDQTVMGLSGVQGSAVTVGYSAADSRWALTVTDSATAVTATAKATGFLPSTESQGDHLALVYSAVFGDVVLYINGVESARVPWDNTWDFTTTAFQAGRKVTGATSGAFLSGAVDELRMFQGALDASLVNIVRILADDTSVEATVS